MHCESFATLFYSFSFIHNICNYHITGVDVALLTTIWAGKYNDLFGNLFNHWLSNGGLYFVNHKCCFHLFYRFICLIFLLPIFIQVMSVKAVGIAIKLTLDGVNQAIYFQTWIFAMVAVTCIIIQLNYLNKVSIMIFFSSSLLFVQYHAYYHLPSTGIPHS